MISESVTSTLGRPNGQRCPMTGEIDGFYPFHQLRAAMQNWGIFRENGKLRFSSLSGTCGLRGDFGSGGEFRRQRKKEGIE